MVTFTKEILNGKLHFLCSDSELVVQSKTFCENFGISKFSLKVKQDFIYNAYRMGEKCQISVLTKKHKILYNRWLTIEEALRFLNSFEIEKERCFNTAN